jgi:hypothetical protein
MLPRKTRGVCRQVTHIFHGRHAAQINLQAVLQIGPRALHPAADAQGHGHGGGLGQGRGQFHAQALQLALDEQLGLPLSPAQAGGVSGGAAHLFGQHIQGVKFMGLAQPFGADFPLCAQLQCGFVAAVGAQTALHADRAAQQTGLHPIQAEA